MSDALAGKKATVSTATEIPPVVPSTWSVLDEVYEIGDLPNRAGIYDVTSHGPSLYRETKPGLFELVQMELSCNYLEDSVSTQYDDFYTKFLNQQVNWYRLSWPDTSTHTFKGYVVDITATTPLDDRITYNLTLSIDGDIVYAATP